MGKTLTTLGTTDLRHKGNTKMVLDNVSTLLEMVAAHGWVEDTYFHPALEDKQPGVTKAVDSEHATLDELTKTMEHQVLALRKSASLDLMDALYRHFAIYMAFNLQHFELEEATLEPVFQQHFSEQELVAIQKQVVSGLEVNKFEKFLAIILPAIRPQNRKQLIDRTRNTRSQDDLALLERVISQNEYYEEEVASIF